jgi:peroxiredoxin Q/BCP
MTLETGNKAPDFTAKIDGDADITLSDLRGQNVILYFYPKDNTPGCTKEACAFRDNLPDFDRADAVVLGVSRDSVKKHDNFKAKYELPFNLISDEDGSICEAYGTWVEKSMYGKKFMGIERATFLIDKTGTIKKIWRKVKVKQHVEDVLEAVKDIDSLAA